MQHRRLRITTSLLAVLAVVTLAACGGSKGGSTSDAAAAARAAGPVPYRPGPYAVGRETISVPSPDNPERVLTVDVLYPADRSQSRGAPASRYQVIPGVEFDSRLARSGLPVSTDGPFPLVVYSHGSGGLRFVSSFLTEVLASHGFVVIAPDHSGNTAIDAAAGTTVPSAQNEVNRLADVRTVIGEALARNAAAGDLLTGAIDPERIGIVGHSFGGFTALAAPVGHRGIPAEARIRAVVGLAPYLDPLSDAELARLRVPTMVISGTKDRTTPIPRNVERVSKEVPARPLYRIDLENAAHHSFDDVCWYLTLEDKLPNAPKILVDTVKEYAKQGCAPGLMPNAQAQRLIDEYSVSFLLALLGGKPAYGAYLTPEFAAGQPGVSFSVEAAR